MGIMELLRKSESLVFWNRCRLYSGKEDFRRMVIEGYHNPNFLEIENHGTEYSGNIIYQIGEFGNSVGFFAELLYTLIRLYFAEERGFIPFVSWGKDFLYYEDEKNIKEKNAFLYYFEPVSKVKSTEKAAYVIDANWYHIVEVQEHLNTHGYTVSEEYINEMSSMLKKYIHYNDKTMKYLENGYKELIGNKKALAVHFRGTDYRRQYNNHPVFATVEQEIERVHEVLERNNYDVIFLATDEQSAIKIFQNEFGDKVKFFKDTWRANGEDESVAFSHSARAQHHYLLGLEVLRDQYMLTKCNGLVCGISNLTLTAQMMRRAWYDNDYEDLVILSQGLYHNDHHFCDAKH